MERIAEKYPDITAYEFMGSKANYTRLVEQIHACARALRQMGIREGDKVTMLQLDTNEGMTTTSQEAAVNYLNLTDEMIDKYQILELDEKQTVLGHECTGYNMIQDLQGQQAQVTSWVWNGIPLKSELKMGEITQTIEVLELEEVSEVPAKYVTIPEGAKITEM